MNGLYCCVSLGLKCIKTVLIRQDSIDKMNYKINDKTKIYNRAEIYIK